MKNVTLTLIVLAVSLGITRAASADMLTYNLSNSDNSIILSAVFTADPISPGSEDYNITDMTGTYTDTNFGVIAQSIIGLVSITGPSGNVFLTSDGLFTYDNLLDADGMDPNFQGSVLDPIGGVVFYLANGYEVSLSGATSGFYFAYESPDGVNINSPAGFLQETPSAVPEPSSLLLLGSGLLMFEALLKIKRGIRLTAASVATRC